MEESNESQADASEEEVQDSGEGGRQTKTWYPYITKVQFEKFLSRLESKVPEQIDRDYVRAIIRTPSMIYRFLRGIEAMKLIDRDQYPTPLLHQVISTETRAFALAEVQRDLYRDLLEEQEKSGIMNDEEIVEYFRERTGMGRDSANKMKMFFKYLNGEADFGEPPTGTQKAVPAAAEPAKKVAEPAKEKVAVEAKEEAPPARNNNRERPPQERSREGREGREGRESREGREGRESRESREGRESRPQDRGQSQSTQRQETSNPVQRQERSEPTPSSAQPSAPSLQDRPPRPLTEQQKAYLDVVRSVVSINIDGDWDEDMIRVAFDRLERLLDRIRRI